MSSTIQQQLDQLVAENCVKLFADYQLDMRAEAPSSALAAEPFLLCGIIGFTSKHVRGALVLATTREPLERTNPAAASNRDWICELSNQLLGRIKNQLLSKGVEIFPSTPIALRGEHLSPVLQQRLVAELFTVDGGVVCVWMDCDVEPGFELTELPPISTVPEGEAILF